MLDGSPFPNLLSEFVYTRTYARWLEDQKRRETWPETVRRYVSYIFKDKPVPHGLREKTEKAILDFDVLGSMRALWCAGPAMDRDNVCGYNCMGEETEFITRQGVRRFSDFKDGDRTTVLTHTGAWKPAVVRSYGQQQLFNVTLVRGSSEYTVRATRDHQWVLNDGSRTRELRLKDRLARPPRIVADWDYYSSNPEARNYWAFGYVYGDGTLVKNRDGEYTHSMVRLCGDDKARFLDRFQELGYSTSSPPTFGGDAMAYTGHYLKTLPTIEGDGFENVVAFVRGYLDADGHKNTNGVWPSPFNGIQASKESSIEFIRRVFPAVGAYITQEADLTGEVTNYGVRPKTSRFGLVLGFGDSENSTFSVKGIQESVVETVWCLEVEDDHSFVLPNGIVTGNCSFLPVDNLRAFSEALYILMQGTGVGFSVERTFTDNLPVIAAPTNDTIDYIIQDSTEGWADAVYFGMVQYHLGHRVNWNYSLIRAKGERLHTKGGRASGPEPLKRVLDFAGETIAKAAGRRLKPIEAHDIMCMIAEIVMVGGFRRASLISFSDVDDAEMRDAKDWSKGTFPSIRYMANNSAVYFERPTEEVFWREWDSLAKSGAGERGFSIVNWSKRANRPDRDVRSNPCHEIGLRFKRATDPWTGDGGGGQFCNLTAAVMRPHDTLETMTEKVRMATWLGAIQASYTHFPYLRPAWKELCDEDRLLGVDITGQCDNPALSGDEDAMTYLNAVARSTALIAADALKQNRPAAITCGKPSGNSSQFVDCASGFHTRYAKFYHRHVRISSKDPLYHLVRDQGVPLFKENGQEHLEDDAVDVWVARFPVKSPDGAKLREHEKALEQLERYRQIMRTWCGDKGHNQSATVYVREEEWREVGEWLWKNFDEVTGLSFLPYDPTKYRLAPYVEITEEEYRESQRTMPAVDFTLLTHYETRDEGDGAREAACVGGVCEI